MPACGSHPESNAWGIGGYPPVANATEPSRREEYSSRCANSSVAADVRACCPTSFRVGRARRARRSPS
jgi:hypothetical protein